MTSPPSLPFGKHRGVPLPDVPANYLRWVCRTFDPADPHRGTAAAELRRRGLPVPSPAPPARRPAPGDCPRCGLCPGLVVFWAERRDGRRQLRRECSQCGTWLGTAPRTKANVAAADAAASPTPILDVLIGAQDAGARLLNDGQVVSFALPADYHAAPVAVRRALFQCRHRLAKLLPRGVS